MLELINFARTNPVAEGRFLNGIGAPYAVQARKDSPSYYTNLTGEFSSYPSVPPLAFHPILTATARAHSRDMVSKGYFAHASLDGMTPADRILKAGYGYDFAGENISGMGVTTASEALECHYGLMIDNYNIEDATSHLGHRLNVLDKDFQEIGIGFAGTRSGGDATQDFGTPSNPVAYIVGVAFSDTNANGFYDPGEGRSNITVTPATGNRCAVTSASGGFAIPIEPVETNSDTVDVPFDVRTANWSDVESYDTSYREKMLSNATTSDVQIIWSGGALSNACRSSVRISRPVLINYRIIGTDDYYYNRQMLTCRSVKADLPLDRSNAFVPGHGVSLLQSPQTMAFSNPVASVRFTENLAINLSASASSGLPVTFSCAPPQLASLDPTNGSLRILGAGTISITASQQGDDTYLPAPSVRRSLVVTRGTGTVSMPAFGTVTYSPGTSIPLHSVCSANVNPSYASSKPGIAKVNGNQLIIMGAGTTVISASIPLSANYTAAATSQPLVVSKAAQSISFPVPTASFSANKVITLGARASSGLPVTYASSDSSVLTIAGVKGTMKRRGTVSVTAKQQGNVNFLPAAPVTNILTL